MTLTLEELEFTRSLTESELEDFLSSLPPSEFDSVVEQVANFIESNETEAGHEGYANEQSAKVAAIQNAKTAATQEIVIPPIVNPERRESCRFDLRQYLLTYFSTACNKGLAPYQEEMVAAFQSVILKGGKRCRAVRRGGLKSTLARIATVWAIDYGHRRFPILVGATDSKANEHRANLLKMVATSAEHREDFPEWTPVLLKRANPKKMLRHNGVILDCSASDERGFIVHPKIHKPDGAPYDLSESQIAPYSMQSTDVSGLSYVNSSAEVVRPDSLVFDDVQTPQSAQSDVMTTKREDAICTTFMGLAGLGETIAAIMVCTVREEDDLTMRFCDRKRHPDWDGQTFPVLIREPEGDASKEHWTVYGNKLRDGATPEDGFALASAYYFEHQSEMDAGGVVAWEKDKEEGYATALQWCMTIKILQPEFFRCELQQKGAKPKGNVTQLDAKELIKRLSHIPRGHVPQRASYLTAFVDSSDHVLWWVLCGWMTDCTGWIVDFGTWPQQPRAHFRKEHAPCTIQQLLPDRSWEEAFVLAHNQLDSYLLDTHWPIVGGGTKTVDLLLKDWSDGQQAKRIKSQILSSTESRRIRPSKGFLVRPGGKPIHRFGDENRDRHTEGFWIERRTENPVHVQVDTNAAKEHTKRRLQTVVGAPSALLLPGSDEESLMMLAEHLTAEKAKEWTVNGIDGIYYEDIPGRDNDYWDCVVGNVVAASMLGCGLTGEMVVAPPKKSLKFSDLQKQKERIVA